MVPVSLIRLCFVRCQAKYVMLPTTPGPRDSQAVLNASIAVCFKTKLIPRWSGGFTGGLNAFFAVSRPRTQPMVKPEALTVQRGFKQLQNNGENFKY